MYRCHVKNVETTDSFQPYVPYASWNATTGWDPVTGLGTPDYGKLLALQ